ncbi:unnamed protein product [Amoebophrya sp. A120]|nr:unnamed protein product [Amoebophrya sp. A120]|eukprot:GSA120T00008571001.1
MPFLSCRACSENPLSVLQDLWGGKQDKPDKKKASASSNLNSNNSKTSNETGNPAVQQNKSHSTSKRRLQDFLPRDEEALKACVEAWTRYAHPRASEFFATPDSLQNVLEHLARGIHKGDDPVLGEDSKCVYWYGDVTKDDAQAAIKMIKPGEAYESITYVNRVLAFIFATDESFENLMTLPKEPFKMSCGDQLCVNLSHISLQVDATTNGDPTVPAKVASGHVHCQPMNPYPGTNQMGYQQRGAALTG